MRGMAVVCSEQHYLCRSPAPTAGYESYDCSTRTRVRGRVHVYMYKYSQRTCKYMYMYVPAAVESPLDDTTACGTVVIVPGRIMDGFNSPHPWQLLGATSGIGELPG